LASSGEIWEDAPATKTKATVYTTLVRPDLEYASPVWDPHQITTTRDIEQVQRRAARFAYNCYQDNSPGCEHVSRLMQSENGISIYIYIYQSTYAIRKRHIIAVLHISKPWK
jgi:hypothetical protein